MYKIMDGNEACSLVAYNFSELAGIYPITPASPMAENVDSWSAEGKKNYWGSKIKVVEMESEAGAIAMVHGALQNGILATTFTASQGLLLMIPNMYKIAGQLFPCVINVASRSLASHSLSILGDHQDIYAARTTGFAILQSSSVQEVMDLSNVSYLSTMEGKVPFINTFDGFRTSHELQKIEVIDFQKVKELINEDALKEFRSRALSINNLTRGTNTNDDIYFQLSEARNKYYDNLPDIVNEYMKKINAITGRDYKPFNYYGAKDATKIIVAMGSICETIKETINSLKGEKIGLIEVHLYRPFSSKYLLDVLPDTVTDIAVLSRTKEHGTSEPLYLDISNVIRETGKNIKVVGGRYGLSSKDTDPSLINAVYKFLDRKDKFNGFTIGIKDDLTNLSLDPITLTVDNETKEVVIYGFGSDGMVSVSKDIIKIVGNNTDSYVQGYFEYDSKKSGSVTKSHMRFASKPIKSTYYVNKPCLVVCTKDSYLSKFDMLDDIVENGTFIVNTFKDDKELFKALSNKDRAIIKNRNIKVYSLNANKISNEVGLGNKINTIMATAIFKVSKLIDFEIAFKEIKKALETLFKNKGTEVIEKNNRAIDRALETLTIVDFSGFDDIEDNKSSFVGKSIFDLINERRGYSIPVSEFEKIVDGSFVGGRSKEEKRNITDTVPVYNEENCIMCNMCAFVCPHGVIRPFLLNEEEVENAPESLKAKLIDANIKDQNLKYAIGVNIEQCTGCGLCVNICPGKKGEKALVMTAIEQINDEETLRETDYLFNVVTEKQVMTLNTVKGSQFATPKFEYSGACAGCGETPYIKLLTQLFGEELVIANATGCSSIYGGSVPSTPYSVPWANSLFEDNAEFGFGMRVSEVIHKDKIKMILRDNLSKINDNDLEVVNSYLEDTNLENSKRLYEIVDSLNIPELLEEKDFIKTKSFWIIGGDGWAYDIGYNGLDHVLASNEDVNILVLDTEMYSNTGGQASKSSKYGGIAKFAASGKETHKKNLAKMAMTYPHVYVATVSLGANMMQTIKAFNEAKNHKGPSLIIAYSPCIVQGIKAGMGTSIEEEKKATESGYFPIFRYNPTTEEFSLDSKADFDKYEEFLDGENRYAALNKVNPEKKDDFYDINKREAIRVYEHYESLKEDKKITE